MAIVPRAASENWQWVGSLQPGCGTWTGSFYLWAWAWRVPGSGMQSGYARPVDVEPCAAPEEAL